MTEATAQTIQTVYLFSSAIGILAMIPQIRKLIVVKQSDGLSLTTWVTWGCCQVVSFLYAISVGATAYMYVNVAWITFYITMVFLIIKYRKRRGLIETVAYWFRRSRTDTQHLRIDDGLTSPKETA